MSVQIGVANHPDQRHRIDGFEARQGGRTQVRACYQRIGFDMPAMLARWGVKASLGFYQAPADLQ
jgi:hypothetical protein